VTRRRQGSEARPADVAGQGSEERPSDVEGEISNLRCLLARASALVRAAESAIDRAPWGDNADEDRRRLEDLSHLVGAAGEALAVANDNGNQLAARLAKLTATRIAGALAKHSSGGA